MNLENLNLELANVGYMSAGICDTCTVPKLKQIGDGVNEPEETILWCNKVNEEIFPDEPLNNRLTCKYHVAREVSMSDIMKLVASFSDDTFGTERTFHAPLHHLKKEVDEALANGAIEEFADMLLLLLDAFRKRVGGDDYCEITKRLLKNCDTKLTLNRNRTWLEPTEHGVVEHTRDSNNDTMAMLDSDHRITTTKLEHKVLDIGLECKYIDDQRV